MAITSYATLKTAIGDWLARSDLSTPADDFIDLAEAQIARVLRVAEMVTALDDDIAGGVLAVPTGFLEFTSVYIDGSPASPLKVTSVESIIRDYPSRSADSKPRYIAREGANFIFGPYPDANYTVKGAYYAKFAPLGDGTNGTVTTNYLTDEAPDLILFGALMEAAPYIGSDSRIAIWEQKYVRALDAAQRRDKASRFSSRMSLATVAR